MLDGKRLIELPDKTVELHKLEFSEEERAIYQMVRTYYLQLNVVAHDPCCRLKPVPRPPSIASFGQELCSRIITKVGLSSPSIGVFRLTTSFIQKVLVLLLRLRQVCSHPALIQEDGVALVGPEGSDESATADINGDLNRAETLVGMEFVKKMKHKLKELTLRRIEAEKASVDAEIEEEDVGCHPIRLHSPADSNL